MQRRQFLTVVALATAMPTRASADADASGIVERFAAALSAHDIAAWSAAQEDRRPDNPESLGYFNDIKLKCAPERADIASWFDLLDVDDYVSFGG